MFDLASTIAPAALIASKMPINSHYARLMFEKIKINPHRKNFKVIVGGSGGWQIIQSMAALGARTIREMQQVELVYAPSVQTEGKSWQRAR